MPWWYSRQGISSHGFGFIVKKSPGDWFIIKMPSYQHRKSHCGDKVILWPSYLHIGISYTGKMTSLCWIKAQVFNEEGFQLPVQSQCDEMTEKCNHSNVILINDDCCNLPPPPHYTLFFLQAAFRWYDKLILNYDRLKKTSAWDLCRQYCSLQVYCHKFDQFYYKGHVC